MLNRNSSSVVVRADLCIDPSLRAALSPLSFTYITAAAQNRWQNNVFKGITLQLMASLRKSLSHLPCEWSGRSVPSTAGFKMMSSTDYTHLDSIWKCIHIYLVYLHCICIDQSRVKVKSSKFNQHIGTYWGGCMESTVGVTPMPFMMSLWNLSESH